MPTVPGGCCKSVMRLEKVDNILEVIADLGETSIEVQDLLTRGLLVVICGEFEKKLRSVIAARCGSIDDESVGRFVSHYTNTVIRSSRIEDIKAVAARFGAHHKAEFRRRLERDRQAEEMYGSIVSNRNDAAHGGDVGATIDDVREYYVKAHVVLDHFAEALGSIDVDGGGGTHADHGRCSMQD